MNAFQVIKRGDAVFGVSPWRTVTSDGWRKEITRVLRMSCLNVHLPLLIT